MFINHPLYIEDISRIAAADIDWQLFQGRHIAITGATGLIGTVLVDALMWRNQHCNGGIGVCAVGRSSEKARERFGGYFDDGSFSFCAQNLRQPFHPNGPFDYIIHGASNTHPVAYATSPIDTLLLTVEGTKSILDYAATAKVQRTLFLSTVEIYGENRGDVERFDEIYSGYLDCNTPRAAYPEGKRAAEALCQAYIREKGLDVVIARCCRVFGPTMANDDSKAIAQFLRRAAAGEPIVLKSKGEQRFSFCYAADVCTALLRLLASGKNGEAYNVAAPGPDPSLGEIAKMIAKAANTKVIFELPNETEAAGFSKASTALLDSAKLAALDWAPAYSLEEGIKRTLTILGDSQVYCGNL